MNKCMQQKVYCIIAIPKQPHSSLFISSLTKILNMSKILSDEELRAEVKLMMTRVDLEKTSIKTFVCMLSQEHNDKSFVGRKKFIKSVISDALIDGKKGTKTDDEADSVMIAGFEVISSYERTKRPAPITADENIASIKPGTKGFKLAKMISKDLGDLLNVKKYHLSRAEIVKLLWVCRSCMFIILLLVLW